MAGPIDGLPPEVLAVIFVHHGCENKVRSCFHDNDYDDAPSDPTRSSHHIPALVLAAVCSHWRQIAFSLTCLWDHITLIHERYPTYAATHSLSVMQFLLDRSDKADLYVKLRMQYTWPETEHIQQPFALLCQHSYRWKVLDADMDAENEWQWKILASIRGSLGRLEELSLDARVSIETLQDLSFNNGELPSMWQDLFKDCPQLKRITSFPIELGLPQNQLTHAHLRLSKWSALSSFPKLHSARLSIPWSNNARMDREENPIRFTSRIRELTFALCELEDLSAFQTLLQQATFPRLNSVFVEPTRRNRFPILGAVPFHDIKELVERSSCIITTFSVTNVWVNPLLIELLHSLPTITHFILQHDLRSRYHLEQPEKDEEAKVICQLIQDLTLHENPILLPHLTSLSLHCPGSEDLKDDAVIAMIQSRLPPETSSSSPQGIKGLQYFEFQRADRPFGDEFITELCELKQKQAGLVVSVRDSIGGGIDLR